VEVIIAAGFLIAVFYGGIFVYDGYSLSQVNDYVTCTYTRGSVILESYPEQCRTRNGSTFTRVLTPDEKDRLNPPEDLPENDAPEDLPIDGSFVCTTDVIMCPDGSYIGRLPPNCEFPECPGVETPEVEVFGCTPEQKEVRACITTYQPVCGSVNVLCIIEPCLPVLQTFSNSCIACQNRLVGSYTEGPCIQ